MAEQPSLKIMPYQRSIFSGEDAVPSQRTFEAVDPETGGLAYEDVVNTKKARAARFLIAQLTAQSEAEQEDAG